MDCYRPDPPFSAPEVQHRPSPCIYLVRAGKGFHRQHPASAIFLIALVLILRGVLPTPLKALQIDSTATPLAATPVPGTILAAPAPAERSAADIAAEIIAAETAAYTLRTASPLTFKSDSTGPEIVAAAAMERFRLEMRQKIAAINGPDSTFFQPFLGLKTGAADAAPHGAVERLQRALLQWNAKLPLKINGHYDEATVKSLTVFKLVYDLGCDGSYIDQNTAGYLLALEEGRRKELQEPQGPIGRLVYNAAQFLGLRYRLGGDGKKATDCGMLTRMALIGAGLVDEVFNRVAATQYKYAEEGQMGLTLIDKNEEPAPGDLVFFNWHTRRARYRYKGITHVGILLGKVGESLYVLEANSNRRERKVTILDRAKSIHRIAGYGRFTAAPEEGPIELSRDTTD
ncbi:MAG TPA: NlpC/P60 family protein [bacterium]|nr:NlpC/P60 family protein [bacterium]HQI49872.1 NlpC/P60 family protein [bacterium]HQJ64520.1 NlpC/P60 family protein [bacterium]